MIRNASTGRYSSPPTKSEIVAQHHWNTFFVVVVVACIISCVGCQKGQDTDRLSSGLPDHPASDASAEATLLHASSACLAKISKLEEFDERPSDGDHWVKVWLDVQESSGTVPEFLYLVREYGGLAPAEVVQEWRQRSLVLRHDSLNVGEQHWFIFSEDYDSATYPPKVAAWWRHSDGSVPRGVVEAIRHDRFKTHPVWDKTLNVVYEAKQENKEIQIRVREADTLEEQGVLFNVKVPGKLTSLRLNPSPGAYEIVWPKNGAMDVVSVSTVAQLPAENPFDLPPASYRINYAFELKTGRKLAVWVLTDQEIWPMMHAFQQYDRETGETITDMQFELLETGGIEAGSDSENWYQKTIRTYESGQLVTHRVYRHEYIKTGIEPVDSSSHWIPVGEE